MLWRIYILYIYIYIYTVVHQKDARRRHIYKRIFSHAHRDFTFHSIQTQVRNTISDAFLCDTHTRARAQILERTAREEESSLGATNRLSGPHQRLHNRSTRRARQQAGAGSQMWTAKTMKNRVLKDRKRRHETSQFKSANQGRKKRKNRDEHEFSDSSTSHSEINDSCVNLSECSDDDVDVAEKCASHSEACEPSSSDNNASDKLSASNSESYNLQRL